jgi:uncharacterized protein YndB with AHSA1/START domain
MAVIERSIEVSRRPEEVFSYVTDFTHYPEWQGGIVSARRDDGASISVGSSAVVTRRVGPRELTGTEVITELDPPKSWVVRAVGGPVGAIARGVIEPLGGGERSLVTIALEFEAHGIGRLLVPLVVRRQARRQLPRNEQRLKEVLELGA